MDAKTHSRAELELITVYEIGKSLNSSLDVEKTCRESLNVLIMHMGFRRAMVVLKEPDDTLQLFQSVGLTPTEIGLGHYHSGEGVIGRVFSTGLPIIVPDIAMEPQFLNRTMARADDAEQIAFVAVPIKAGNDILGVLTIDRVVREPGGFADNQRLLTMVANLLGHALVLSRNVAAAQERLLIETQRLQKALKGRTQLDKVIGVSRTMQAVFAEVHQVGPSRSTVLLRGESGTGKEVIARAIHELSPRKDSPFIKVNCAALSESLLESELFGHEKGSFTGAVGERKGRFELAHGGTLFLDEIGDISASFQAKLLRVLQEREFERVGGSRPIKVDVRLICATNRNLEKMVAAGTFRSDLYYRINVVSVFLPPLRERREDIPPLVAYFLERYNKENGRDLRVSTEAMKVLSNCYWPGNVRELENCVERTATMTSGTVVQAVSFPCFNDRCLTQLLHHLDKDDAVAPSRQRTIPVVEVPVSERVPAAPAAPALPPKQFAEEKPEGERDRLIWAMERSGWVQAKAARLLNITPRQMGYALMKYGIEVHKF